MNKISRDSTNVTFLLNYKERLRSIFIRIQGLIEVGPLMGGGGVPNVACHLSNLRNTPCRVPYIFFHVIRLHVECRF